MRICYLAWHGSVHTRRWVGWFAERGHDVHVVTCGGGDARDFDVDGNALPLRYQVHDLGEPRFGKLGYFLKLFKARRVVREINAEVVHAHWLTSYGLLALFAREKHKLAAPLVVTAHGDDVLIAPRNPLLRRIVSRVLRAASLVTVPSDNMREAATELIGDHGPARSEVVVFQYGVEVSRLAKIGKKFRAPQHDHNDAVKTVVSTRAFLSLYRIDVVIAALKILRNRGHEIRLALYGDGPERSALETQVADAQLEAYCRFFGNVSSSTLERAVAASDAYVSVSESDGLSLSLLEALALGAVPVLSDIPANRPWVSHANTGVLVEIDPAAVADGIELALSLDRSRVAVDNAAVVAERADRDTNLAACEILIDSLIGVTWEPSDAAEDSRAA